MNNNEIKISIIVPCYNQAQYMGETLQSVLDQEFQKWECLIVNDGSPDNTEEIALEWEKKDSRFKYLRKENGGVGDTRNYGIERAVGEYILPLDSDDYIGPRYVSEALTVFEKNPNTRLVYCNKILFGTRNQKFITPDFSLKNLLVENYISPSGIYRKSDYLQTPGYSNSMSTQGLEDWDFWLHLLADDPIVVKLQDFHFFYRVKDVSMLTEITIEKNERLLKEIFKNNMELYLKHFNPIRDHISADDYKRELNQTMQSTEYRIGKLLCYPYRIATRAIKKLLR